MWRTSKTPRPRRSAVRPRLRLIGPVTQPCRARSWRVSAFFCSPKKGGSHGFLALNYGSHSCFSIFTPRITQNLAGDSRTIFWRSPKTTCDTPFYPPEPNHYISKSGQAVFPLGICIIIYKTSATAPCVRPADRGFSIFYAFLLSWRD